MVDAAERERWDSYGPNPVPDCPVPGSHIWGWCRIAELEWLHEQAAKMRNIVEVGALRGRSSYALATGCTGLVYCIDPFDDEGAHCEPAFMENTSSLPNVRAVKGYSPAVASIVPRRGRVDMVYIDGDHSRDAIRADIGAWLPKTRKLICGHDYVDHPQAGYPDVKAVVDEVFGDRVTVAPDTAIWAVQL